MSAADLGKDLAALDAKNISAPWEVCTDPQNEYWAAGLTIGSALPSDHRRVCDLSPLASQEMNARIGGLIVALRNNLPAILDALAVKAAMDLVNAPIVLARDTDDRDRGAEELKKWIKERAAEIRATWDKK